MPKRTNDGIKKRCDCGRRQWPTCRHAWWFSFHFNDREHRYSLDKIARVRGVPPPTTKSEAQSWRDRLRNEIRSGTFTETGRQTSPVDSRLTFDDVCRGVTLSFVGVSDADHRRRRTSELTRRDRECLYHQAHVSSRKLEQHLGRWLPHDRRTARPLNPVAAPSLVAAFNPRSMMEAFSAQQRGQQQSHWIGSAHAWCGTVSSSK